MKRRNLIHVIGLACLCAIAFLSVEQPRVSAGPLLSAAHRRAHADPLSDVPFMARFQAYFARNTPLGLYSNTAGTTPAIVGDSAASYFDRLSTSGLSYVQSTAGNRPVIGSENGAIFLILTASGFEFFPGVGNITLPYAISWLERPDVGISLRTISSDTTTSWGCLGRSGASFFFNGTTVSDVTAIDGQFHVGTILCNATGNVQCFLDGVDVTQNVKVVGDWGSLAVVGSGGDFSRTSLIAHMAYPPSYRVRVEAYLNTLKP